MNQPALLKFAVLFLLAYLVLLGLSLQFGQHYIEFLLPLYRWEIAWFAPDYDIVSLAIADSHNESVIALNLDLIRYTVVAGHALPPTSGISSSTLVGHALQHPLMILSLLAAWPASSNFQRVKLFLIAMPLLLLVEMLDVPLVLLGSIEDLMIANIAPDTFSFLVAWMNFMNGGGRLALSIFAALAAVCLGNMWRVFRGND
jgi:hypothetical protein